MKLFRKNHDRIRAVMTDIDGTLVDIESAAIPDEAVTALKKLRKKGIKTYICTGRNRAEIDSGIRSIGWDGMVLINGRLALDENGEVIWNQPIRPDQISGLLEMIRTDYFPVCFVCADQIFLNNRDGSVEQLGVRLVDTWVLPFEAVSVLILVAMIGAIVIARKEEKLPIPSQAAVSKPEPAAQQKDRQ